MNVLGSLTRFKCASGIINIAQGSRGYAAYKKLPVEWVRPKKHSCISKKVSGDLGLDFNISPKNYIASVEECSSILDNESDIVKKIFSVEFQRRKETIKLQKDRAKSLVKRHHCDNGSIESKVAVLTAEILQLQDHQQQFPQNSKSKVFLKELIEKRKKWLKKLRIQDYARFEFLLERLNLVYHPFPEDNPYITRRGSTRKLLQKHCDEKIAKKLDDYKSELKAQQKDYFKEKVKKLEFIRNEEIACGVTPTITLEEIEATKEKAASFL